MGEKKAAEFEALVELLSQGRPEVPVMRGNFVPSTGNTATEAEQAELAKPLRTDGSVAMQGAEVDLPRPLDQLTPALRAKVERMRNL